MITIQHEGRLTVVGVFVTLEVADFRRLEKEIEQQLREHGRIDLLVDLTGMMSYTLDVALEDLKFSIEHARDVGRIALLSEEESVVWTALLSRLFVQAEIRVFDSEELAREWLGEKNQR
jgi:stage II sporulation SpoAA-like protein